MWSRKSEFNDLETASRTDRERERERSRPAGRTVSHAMRTLAHNVSLGELGPVDEKKTVLASGRIKKSLRISPLQVQSILLAGTNVEESLDRSDSGLGRNEDRCINWISGCGGDWGGL